MASQSFFDLECANRDVKIVAGRITVASGACTIANGLGFSIGDFSSGVARITLDKSYTALLSASVLQVKATAGEDKILSLQAHDVSAATPTVDIQSFDVGSAGNVDPSDGEILFTLYLLDGEVS